MSAIEPKPVEKIELNEKNVKLRFIIFIISIVALIVSAIFIVVGTVKKDSGWTEVLASPKTDINSDDDFYLYYRLGTSGNNVNAELKGLSDTYTTYLEKSYILLNEYKEYDNYKNLAYINNHPNEEVEVDEFLYNSIKEILKENNRLLYSGLLVEYYDSLILADSYDTALKLNPYKNEDKKLIVNELANYINDSNLINLELKDNYKIKLNVSDELLSFAEDNEYSLFLSFSYLKNAFIIDYVSDALIKNNYIYGNLSSYDGYFKNLNNDNNLLYDFNIIDINGKAPQVLGAFRTNKQVSIVSFRDFKYYVNDLTRYYEFEDSKTINYYIDLKTGMPKASKTAIVGYDYNDSCVNIALKLSKIFINDEFIPNNDINLIYVENNIIYHNEEGIEFINLLKYGDTEYKAELKR